MQVFRDAPIWVKNFLMLVVFGAAGIGGYIALESLVSNPPQKLLFESPKPVDSELQNVSISVQEKRDPNLIPKVDVQILSDGPPTLKSTDSNGYLEIQIPTRKTITIILKKKGYKPETYLVNLQTDPKTTRTFYMEPEESPSPSVSPPEGAKNRSDSLAPSLPSSFPSASPTSLPRGTGTLTNKYVGSWIGQVSQNNSSKQISAQIEFNTGNVGSKVGKVSYNGTGVYCRGVLILQNTKSDSIELFENITYNDGGCTSNRTVTIKQLGADILDYKWTLADSQIISTGKLTRP